MTDRVDDVLVPALRAPTATAVRRRLFRQTLASLVYEGAADVSADGREHVIAGIDRDGRPVRYLFEADRAVGFDRVRLSAEPVRREDADGAVAEAASLPQFLGEVRAAILGGEHPEQLARFAVELEETRVKDVLAEYVRAGRHQLLADADHEALEGLITDGHRYHPAYKSRIGFDLDDDVAYGPEFLPVLHPFWVAAHRSVAEVTTSSVDPPDPRAELGPTAAAAFDARIHDAGGDPADYAWLPVHPWQWRERLRRAFADLLADGRLVALGPDPASFSPQQSIRTLSCRDDPARSHLKTALSITNTSTSRRLAPHTVRNAAPISDWLARIVARDDFLARDARVIVLGEVHGVAVVPAPRRTSSAPRPRVRWPRSGARASRRGSTRESGRSRSPG